MTCETVPTAAEIEQAKKNMQDLDSIIHDTEESIVDSKGRERITLEGALALFGFGAAPFTFTEGGSLTSRNLLVSNDPVDGFLYRYIGAGVFPVTVTPGTDPTASPADWEAFTATNHNLLAGRANEGAHPATSISKDGGGDVQDFIDAQFTNATELATGKFSVGEYVRLIDRDFGVFLVQAGGVVDGRGILDAGGGNSAVLIPSTPINLSEYGFSFNKSSYGLDGVRTVSLGGRFGDLAYSYSANPKLLTDLSSIMPDADMLDSSPYRYTYYDVELIPANWVSTGNPQIFRYVVSGWEGEALPINYVYNAYVQDIVTGRAYGARRDFVSSVEWSCQLYASAGNTVTLEILVPNGQTPSSSLVLKVANYEPRAKNVVFIDPINGVDGADGRSEYWAVKTFVHAFTLNPDVIVLSEGNYINNYIGIYTAARDLSVICPNGRARIVSNSVTYSAWTLESGTVYRTDVGGSPTPVGVADLLHDDEFGNPLITTQVNSIAECQSTPNSFYYDAAFPRRMYVNLIDGSAPTSSDVVVLTAVVLARHSAPSQKVYFENIDTIGGSAGGITARNTDADAVLIAKNCGAFGSSKNGFDVLDVGICLTIDCVAAYNTNDGFNYTAFNGISPHFIEVNGVGYRNKEVGTGNGSTSHDDCVGFRINGNYFENNGPGMVDVGNAVTHSVNISSTSNATYGVQSSGNAIVEVNGLNSRNNNIDVDGSSSVPIKIRSYSIETFSGSIEQI